MALALEIQGIVSPDPSNIYDTSACENGQGL